jgi:hypothetical protein
VVVEDTAETEATLAELADLVLAERERREEAERTAAELRSRIEDERRLAEEQIRAQLSLQLAAIEADYQRQSVRCLPVSMWRALTLLACCRWN